ncbi:MAG: hypothetical protein KGI00_04160 [Candidatus Micrarchaeota archaeon]|nr:hypothetical protein [Candidatus Micrarchaeota archaeon]MDE1849894.1 hypothetical protein [Candidatus Micrarchaeota archaeon]
MNYIVALPLNKSLAEFMGKKGSENGITFYNRKADDNVIVVLMPTDINEKIYGLMESMLIAGQIVISTENVDRSLGEALIAASLLDKRLIITSENDIGALLSGTSIKNFELSTREELLGKITSHRPESRGALRVDIDKAFNVKGIGTVALGVVTSGTVKVHDNLFNPLGKQVNVKSIQSQDQDMDTAGIQTRVGLALKGIESDELDKGDILSTKQIKRVKKFRAMLKTSSFAKENVENSRNYLVAIGFSHAEAKIEMSGNEATITLARPASMEIGDQLLVARSAAPRIFASGRVEELIEYS